MSTATKQKATTPRRAKAVRRKRPRALRRARERRERRRSERREFPSSIPRGAVAEILTEFEGVKLGDPRLERRLPKVVERLCAAPGQSFPRAIGDDSQLEGAYRFMKNKSVTFEGLLASHYRNTCERAVLARRVIVAHDTSEIDYSGTPLREGLGRLRGNGGRKDQGFLAHCALAIAAGGSRQPLGLLGAKVSVRTGPKSSRTKKGRRVSGREYSKRPDKESARWAKLVDECEAKLGGCAELIHVMDREADALPLLRHLTETDRHFVARLSRDRVVDTESAPGEGQKLREALAGATDYLEVDAPVSRRKGKTAPRHAKALPGRKARTARLRFSAMRLSLRKPTYVKGPEWLPINVVWVHEVNCQEGEEPIEWILATSEPIETKKDIEAIVEYYRTRWLIEEFFKALKTGCGIEKRLLESYHGLLNALALCVPIAVQMLALRSLAHRSPDAPASDVLSPTQLHVLRHLSRRPLDEHSPTAQQALVAIAGIGGHLKRNGEPGWQTLGRGLEKLVAFDAGYRLGLAQRDGP